MKCEEVRKQFLPGLLAREGTPEPVARHLESCGGCQAELRALRETWELLGRWPEASPGEEVRKRLLRTIRRGLLRESVLTVSGWTPAVLASAVGVAVSLVLSLLVPYSTLVSLCRQALQVSESHPGAYLLAGMAYGLPLAVGAWVLRKRVLSGALIRGLEASLLFLVILAPYVIVQCREFPPLLQVAFVSGLAGGAIVSSLGGLGLARLALSGGVHT